MLNISKLLRDIKEGKRKVFCNGRRISYYNGKFWGSTIATERSYSESGIRAYINKYIDTLECQ